MDSEELHEQLSCIRDDVAAIKAEQRVQGDRIMSSLQCVYGNGESPGIKVRLDRVEQDMFRRAKFFWAIVAAVFGLVAERIADLFHHR